MNQSEEHEDNKDIKDITSFGLPRYPVPRPKGKIDRIFLFFVVFVLLLAAVSYYILVYKKKTKRKINIETED